MSGIKWDFIQDVLAPIGENTAAAVNNNKGNGFWSGLKDSISEGWQYNLDQWKDDIENMRENGSAGTGMDSITSILSTGAGLATSAINAAQIKDTSAYHNQIAGINGLGMQKYGSFSDIDQDSHMIDDMMPDASYDKIRGMSDGQQLAAIGSGLAQGAITGYQVGGPWGAAAGAIIGAGSQLLGVVTGNGKAATELQSIEADSHLANLNAQRRLQRRRDELIDYNFNQGVINAVATGGPIERKQESIQEFAKRVMKKPQIRQRNPHTSFKRDVVEGGIRIRFKR